MEKNKIKYRVCYFGTFSRGEDYPRNNCIINGLREKGVEVLICHADLWGTHQEKMTGVKKGLLYQAFCYIIAYTKLAVKYIFIGKHDVMFVGYLGHIDMFPARLLAWIRRKPIVFDAFYSLYETVIEDRKLYDKKSLAAKILRFIDRWSCRLADLVLLDTNAHIDYFRREYRLENTHFLAIPPGTDESIFKPRPERSSEGKLNVISYSSYIPLHGIDVQIEAAAKLGERQDIQFLFVGKGQMYPEIRERADSMGLAHVKFIDDWLPLSDLAELIAQSDVCLGIFGITEKAKMVIPYKVYMAMAMGKPVVTGDSGAARELLMDGVHALLSPMGDAEALSRNLLKLRDDIQLRKEIGQNGLRLFLEKCTMSRMAEAILDQIESLLFLNNQF
jgi:glycosyltransferase involved in cell wall biosynthesis